ncbi:cupin domain-containing protein [Haloferax sp. DFSO52]|uniref:cupin domain-containing protein n=1 Tax=Haloferax sp. DFSO52 TaxID=3388505 RepID=UPI003A88839A
MDRIATDDVESTEAVEDVYLGLLAGGEKMNIQHVRIEPGGSVPVHHHPHEQVGYIFAGELTFIVGDEGEEIVVGPGDSYSLASEEPHGAENRGDETVIGIDVFSPPRDNPPWLD